MKNILITLIILLGFTNIYAQHTLQYNQSMLIDSIGGAVPSGRVWKVVSLLPESLPLVNVNEYTPLIGTFAIIVNSSPIYASSVNSVVVTSNYYYSVTNSNSLSLPIWLPAGATLAASTNIKYVSVIEFIVQ